jgi:hypothetical protein
MIPESSSALSFDECIPSISIAKRDLNRKNTQYLWVDIVADSKCLHILQTAFHFGSPEHARTEMNAAITYV